MRKPAVAGAGWRSRLRYRFDLALSRGPVVVIGWLGVLTVLVFVVAGVLLSVLGLTGVDGGERLGLAEGTWQALLRTLDPGTFSGDTGWPTRLVTLAVTLAGIFIAGSLIGLIANAVDQRVEQLRKGRSRVLERDHTVVLGWSPRVPTLVAELVTANRSRRRAVVAVLAEEDKTVMEDELRAQVGDFATTRVVCRTGRPGLASDLDLVNVRGARSVVVTSRHGGDADAVKAVLALRAAAADLSCPVVVEVTDPDLAVTLRSLTDGRVVTVTTDHVVAELTAQACRQSGLSQVYRQLLDFAGHEVYFRRVPELDGATYGEAVLSFEEVAVIGCWSERGGVRLNPPHDTVLTDEDELLGIAEDDATFVLSGRLPYAPARPVTAERRAGRPQRVLVVGWSSLAPKVLREMDEWLLDGSSVLVVVDDRLVPTAEVVTGPLEHTAIEVRAARGGPEALGDVVAGADFDQVIVISYRENLARTDADARTLLTLLALRRLWPPADSAVTIVAEVLDRNDVDLAQATGVDDWIVGEDLTSFLLAQLSERAELGRVFDELFDADGATLSLEPALRYGDGTPTTVGALAASAQRLGESLVGYRLATTREVVVNPPKRTPVLLGEHDRVLVVRSRPRTTPVRTVLG